MIGTFVLGALALVALVVIVKALPSKPANREVETDLTHCGWMRGN